MPTTATEAARLEDRFTTAFELHDGHTLNGRNAAIHAVRRSAIARFAELGFPPPRTEAWKYTNIRKWLQHDYEVRVGPADTTVTRADVEQHLIPGFDAHVLVLVNGRYVPELSSIDALQEGVLLEGFAKASEAHRDLLNAHFAQYASFDEEPFTALNTAFTQDGVFLYVPENVAMKKPVHIISLLQTEEDAFVQPRLLMVAEHGSAAKLIQTNYALDAAQTFTNSVAEVFVGANAHVRYYVLQDEGDGASTVNRLHVYQEGDSTFSTTTVTLSGDVVRNNLTFLPDAENCETNLNGLFLGKQQMHVDNNTLVDHAKPRCVSNELYKGILDDESMGVFNGKVLVRQDAQQINAYQSNKSIVLTETAKMYSKPELEIYADDVRCSHGATSGQLDEEALFYLRSRGIPARRARALLLLAFARDVLDTIDVEPFRAMLDERVENRLHA